MMSAIGEGLGLKSGCQRVVCKVNLSGIRLLSDPSRVPVVGTHPGVLLENATHLPGLQPRESLVLEVEIYQPIPLCASLASLMKALVQEISFARSAHPYDRLCLAPRNLREPNFTGHQVREITFEGVRQLLLEDRFQSIMVTSEDQNCQISVF